MQKQAKPNINSFSTYTKEKKRIKLESNTYTTGLICII